MDAEAVRQMRMGLGWVFMIRGDAIWIVLDYWLDHNVLAGLYRIGWIVSLNTGFLCAFWLLAGWDGWDGWTGWNIGETGAG